MAARIMVGTKENCCLGIASSSFQVTSAGNDLRHFISLPWAFPKDNPLGLHLVTSVIFSSPKSSQK